MRLWRGGETKYDFTENLPDQKSSFAEDGSDDSGWNAAGFEPATLKNLPPVTSEPAVGVSCSNLSAASAWSSETWAADSTNQRLFSSVLIRVTTVTAVTMDDFLLNSRFTTQRDIIVGGSDAVPDISHFVAEEIIISDVTSG